MIFEVEIDTRSWERRSYDVALYETNQQRESQRLELCKANQWADQAQRENSGIWRPEYEKQVFKKNRAKDCKSIQELRRICFERADRARQVRIDDLCMQQKEKPSLHRESAFVSESGTAGQGEVLE